MRRSFRRSVLVLATTAALPLALAACGTERQDEEMADGDLPDPQISGSPDPVSDEEIEEAVPGIEQAYPEGDTPNDLGIRDENDAEYSEPDEQVEPRQ